MKVTISKGWLAFIACVIGIPIIAGFLWKPRAMPPGYILQTDGEHWRFIALEQGVYFTNLDNGLTRRDCVGEAWKIYRLNRHTYEWRNAE